MAASGHPTAHAASPSAANTPQIIAQRRLPAGPCRFRDLNGGKDSFECGCRQFWLNESPRPASEAFSTSMWCFCGHHGCYHEQRSPEVASSGGTISRQDYGIWSAVPTIENTMLQQQERQQSITPHTPQARSQSRQRDISRAGFSSNGLGLFSARAASSRQATPRLDQLNPQQFFADYLPSTQVSQTRQSQSTPVLGQRPHSSPDDIPRSHFALQRPDRPQIDPQNLPMTNTLDEQPHSATEIATPSNAGSPALREADQAFQSLRTTLEAFNRKSTAELCLTPERARENVLDAQSPTPQARPQSSATAKASPDSSSTAAQLAKQIAHLRSILSTVPNISTSLTSLNNRLETLETVSFSHMPIEEIYDKLENFDGRILDNEARLTDLERAKVSSRTGRGSTSAEVSFDSVMSENSNQVDAELIRQISDQTMIYEQRLRCLEASALPTLGKPWEVEVILFPFGHDLKGLWSAKSAQAEAAPSATANSMASTQSGLYNEQASSGEWKPSRNDLLFPRACGPSQGAAGICFERLKSRGFVKTVTIHGNSAHHVSSVITSAFSSELFCLTARDADKRHDRQDLLGLKSAFIPLRKIHKSATLRFLTPAELVTPSLWTAEFLNASVFMRAPSTGLRRLFITTSSAYVQHATSRRFWSWSKIRELPRFKDAGTNNVEEADALEPCWDLDHRLDPEPINIQSSTSSGLSYHSSFNSHILSPQPTNGKTSSRGLSEASEFGESDEEAPEHDMMPMPTPESPITPVSSMFMAHALRGRPVSEPRTQTETSFQIALSKRQVASFDHLSPIKNAPKRRRISPSPEDVEPIELWNPTPRRSREPQSPYPHDQSSMATSRRGSSDGRRSTMPMMGAYATPYSAEVPGRDESDNGTDMDDEDDDDNDKLGDKPDRQDGQKSDDSSEDSSEGDDDDDDDGDDEEDEVMSEAAQFSGGFHSSQDGKPEIQSRPEDDEDEDIWEGVDDEDTEDKEESIKLKLDDTHSKQTSPSRHSNISWI